VADWSEQRHIPRAWLATVSVAVLVALAVTARVQLDHWADNISLWSHTLQVTGPNFIAENSLGIALQRAGRADEAIAHFRRAVAINPDDAASNLNLAEYDRQHGNLIACIERCKKIPAMTQLTIQKVQAYEKMALAYRALGDSADARKCEEEADKIQRAR
jgi:tetratricopeptide (TPR) repeat protein